MKHLYVITLFSIVTGISLHAANHAAADNSAQVIALLDEINRRSVEGVERILNGNVDINVFCIIQQNPANIIISKQAPTSRCQQEYSTPLHFAVIDNDPSTSPIIEKLIHHDKSIVDVESNYFETPLHTAIRRGNVEAFTTLLKYTADINKSYFGSFTLLHKAAYHGNKESVILLLEKGADPRSLNVLRKTPAEIAREKGHDDIAKLIDNWENEDIKEPECE